MTNIKTLLLVGIAVLTGAMLSACRQTSESPRAEAEKPVELQAIHFSLEADAESEPFMQTPQEEASSPKAITYDLGTKTAYTDPKFREVTAGTKFLCIVRSSNPRQPVNYIPMTWKRTGTTYTIEHTDGDYPFSVAAGEDLGTLYMMIVVGGEWDQVNKKLRFKGEAAQLTTDASGREIATIDAPYISAWQELTIEDSTPTALKMKLRGYKTGSGSPNTRFTLKPQGMFLRMRVENEMGPTGTGANERGARAVNLHSLTFRSTAYASAGSYDLSEASIKSNASKPAEAKNAQLLTWSFDDTNVKKTSSYSFATPIALPYNDTGRTKYNAMRDLWNYPNSPYLLCWVKPTGQTVANMTAGDVQTEIFAHVEDVRTNTVYSNKEGVDTDEAGGKIVVPSMRALPVYASRRLASRGTTPVPFAEGTAYRLTLNVNRQSMILDLLSEYPVNASGTAFVNSNYDNTGYFRTQSIGSGTSGISLADGTKWIAPTFSALSSVFGINHRWRSNGLLTYGIVDKKYPNIHADRGTYEAEVGFRERGDWAFSYTATNVNDFIVYTMVFYPSSSDATGAINALDASHTSVTRYEYGHTLPNGTIVMKMTQRFLGAYSIDAALFDAGVPRSDYSKKMVEDLNVIISKGDSYWTDPLRSQDDVVRYFPLLGYKRGVGRTYPVLSGNHGLLSSDADGYMEYSRTLIKHGTRSTDRGYEDLHTPVLLMRPNFNLPK